MPVEEKATVANNKFTSNLASIIKKRRFLGFSHSMSFNNFVVEVLLHCGVGCRQGMPPFAATTRLSCYGFYNLPRLDNPSA